MPGPCGEINRKSRIYAEGKTGRGAGPAAPTEPFTKRGKRRKATKGKPKVSKTD